MKKYLRHSILALSLFLAPELSRAECTCTKRLGPSAALQFASSVFQGTVRSIKQRKGQDVTNLTFTIRRVWKGALTHELSLTRVNLAGDECNFPFVVGKEYVVFVDKSSLDLVSQAKFPGVEVFDSSLCGGTEELEKVTNIELLGTGRVP